MSYVDLGMFMQSLMLAAKARGLDTCAQGAWNGYWSATRRVLNVPRRGIGERAEEYIAALANRDRISFAAALRRPQDVPGMAARSARAVEAFNTLITGLRDASSNAPLSLPADPTEYPDVVVDALTELRLAGVDGPYALALSTAAYDAISVTTEHGYPIRRQIERVFDGEILWAPAIDGAFLLSTRGGDYTLSLGQDLSIGYLSHDIDSVQLYFQESLTFLAYTTEAIVAVNPVAGALTAKP